MPRLPTSASRLPPPAPTAARRAGTIRSVRCPTPYARDRAAFDERPPPLSDRVADGPPGVWNDRPLVRRLPRPGGALVVATALGAQLACTRLFRLPVFDPWSALISALSLCLLLRTNAAGIAAAAACVAIGSKFLLRWNGKHLFNPTNFALAAILAVTGRAWVSSGQWGSAAFFAFFIACAGRFVVQRAARGDVTARVPGDVPAARPRPLGSPCTTR